MSVIRGTSLSGYPTLVAELGGDPSALLRAARIQLQDVGSYDTFLTYQGMIRAMESAAVATGTPDFGRRLAQRQGIEILGPVGVAARTAATVAEALAIFERYLAAYSPAIEVRIEPLARPGRSFFEFRILLDRLPPHAQVIELALGVSLQVFRFLAGSDWRPVLVHLPHEPVTAREEYLRYFSCPPRFADRKAGFTILTADLGRALSQDEIAHQALVRYLDGVVTPHAQGMTRPVRELVRQLLPTGAATAELVASQFVLHPKTLQRRLRAEGTTFPVLVDQVRKETAERYLRDTDLSLTHLAREVGYAEQSVLTRSCRRWFGRGPAAQRQALRLALPAVPGT